MRLAGVLAALVLVLGSAGIASADEGWTVERFDAQYAVRPDGSIAVTESIDVDFGAQQHHGIFRRLVTRQRYDDTHDRVYDVRVSSVTDAAGRAWAFSSSDEGGERVLKIGDADRTISGRQTYRIAYDLGGALNGFSDHDELFWNLSGTWPVRIRSASAHVQLPSGSVSRVACFQGPRGSTEACRATMTAAAADLSSSRLLGENEQMTIVVGFAKGIVADPKPRIEQRARDPEEWWQTSPEALGGAAGVLVLGMAAVAWTWWTRGRDPAAPDTVIAEYEPPQKLRPAEVGLILDETADPKDLTSTIIDLAVRGYLRIEEIPAHGIFGKKDWKLVSVRAADDALEPYERTLLAGLFSGSKLDEQAIAAAVQSIPRVPLPGALQAMRAKLEAAIASVPAAVPGTEVKLSEIKGTFHATLLAAERLLYNESAQKGWFPTDPHLVRARYAGIGCVVLIVGAFVAAALGAWFGLGFMGVALGVAGVALLVMSRFMSRRSQAGRDLLQHIRGFRRYMETAEKDRQAFAERENIFAAYLPYAIVFGLVSKWAAAFSGLDAQRATQGWYVGSPGSFTNIAVFSSSLETFSGGLQTAIASTPGGSGSSGFGGGGFSGGGGGGGGGGSW